MTNENELETFKFQFLNPITTMCIVTTLTQIYQSHMQLLDVQA